MAFIYTVGLDVADCRAAPYLAGRESRHAAILERRRPLGRDADFHVAERLPGRVQQHVAGETGTGLIQQVEATAA